MIHDTAIIGAGPAGYSAAIYTARAGLNTILFGDPSKGNLYKAHVVGNYFGLGGSPSGADILQSAEKQIVELKVEHLTKEIVGLTFSEGVFTLRDNDNRDYQAKSVVLATGQNYLLAGIQREKDFTGRGVSYCVTCDGFFFKDRPVVVVGNSDYAASEALEIIGHTKQVVILSHGKPLQFSPALEEQLKAKEIKYLETPRIASFEGTDKLEKLIFKEPLADGTTEMPAEGAFMAVGMAGANAFAQKLGIAMNGSYIKIDANGQTTVPGLFAAGDCTGSPPQAAASVGSGCIAALSAIKLIRGLNTYIQYN